MARNNHRRYKTCRYCGQGYVATTLGLRWVDRLTYETVRATFANPYLQRRYHLPRRANQDQLVRAQVHEIACARRMGRPVESY